MYLRRYLSKLVGHGQIKVFFEFLYKMPYSYFCAYQGNLMFTQVTFRRTRAGIPKLVFSQVLCWQNFYWFIQINYPSHQWKRAIIWKEQNMFSFRTRRKWYAQCVQKYFWFWVVYVRLTALATSRKQNSYLCIFFEQFKLVHRANTWWITTFLCQIFSLHLEATAARVQEHEILARFHFTQSWFSILCSSVYASIFSQLCTSLFFLLLWLWWGQQWTFKFGTKLELFWNLVCKVLIFGS